MRVSFLGTLPEAKWEMNWNRAAFMERTWDEARNEDGA